MNEQPSTIIFDLFGTLMRPLDGQVLLNLIAHEGIFVDSQAAPWVASGFPAAAVVFEMGITPTEVLSLVLCNTLHSLADFVSLIRSKYPNTRMPCKKNLIDAERITQITLEGVELVEDVSYVCNMLASRGFTLQLLSNLSTLYLPLFERFNLSCWFKNPVFSCEIGVTKPHRQAFEIALGHTDGGQAIMVGDNWRSDILGALGAGLSAIFLDKTQKHPSRQLLKDVTPFFTSLSGGHIRSKDKCREPLRHLLPIALEAIEDDPLSYLEVDEERHIRLTPLNNVRVVDTISAIPSILERRT